ARFANRDEAGAQAIRDRTAQDEAATLDADHQIDAVVFEGRGQRADDTMEAVAIAQQRGDVVEEDARLRKVGHVRDLRFQRLHRGVVSFESRAVLTAEYESRTDDPWPARRRPSHRPPARQSV